MRVGVSAMTAGLRGKISKKEKKKLTFSDWMECWRGCPRRTCRTIDTMQPGEAMRPRCRHAAARHTPFPTASPRPTRGRSCLWRRNYIFIFYNVFFILYIIYFNIIYKFHTYSSVQKRGDILAKNTFSSKPDVRVALQKILENSSSGQADPFRYPFFSPKTRADAIYLNRTPYNSLNITSQFTTIHWTIDKKTHT